LTGLRRVPSRANLALDHSHSHKHKHKHKHKRHALFDACADPPAFPSLRIEWIESRTGQFPVSSSAAPACLGRGAFCSFFARLLFLVTSAPPHRTRSQTISNGVGHCQGQGQGQGQGPRAKRPCPCVRDVVRVRQDEGKLVKPSVGYGYYGYFVRLLFLLQHTRSAAL
jgi:hypothetical protein